MQVEHEREAARSDRVQIAVDEEHAVAAGGLEVVRYDADERARRAPLQRSAPDASSVEHLVALLEEEPLLRIDRAGFLTRHAEAAVVGELEI